MATAALLVVSLLLAVTSREVFAAQHVVGGGAGWSKSTDYAAWAANKTFAVGDTLVFNYGNKDLVYEVSEDDYKNCSIGKPMIVHHGGGQTVIPLDKPGPRYFLSPTFGHCAGGMKLAIDVKPRVVGASGGANVKVKDPLPPALPGGTCPGAGGGGGGGGGGLPPPFNPFIFGPPNPFGPFPIDGGATNLGKMSMIGFYSLLVLVISFMV